MSRIRVNDEKWLGRVFNDLTVIGFEYRNKRWLWKCKCTCGNETIVYPNQVMRGKTSSCGCARSRTFRDMHYIHGQSHTRLYRLWKDMRRRCGNNPKRNRYYGDKGISVCKEWEDFNVFHKWAVLAGYDDTLSIERIDNNGDYAPANCKWIPVTEQPYNTSKTIMVKFKGVLKPVGQWADDFGLKRPTVYGRISRGWSPEEALEIIKRPI